MKEAVFNLKLEADLRDAFMDAAKKSHRPAAQIVRDLMRGYIQQQEEQEYETFLAQKVDKARRSVQQGHGLSAELVEQEFLARRNSGMQ